MILFLFSNVDHFICEKLGHFIFLAFVKRELNKTLTIAAKYVRIFRVLKPLQEPPLLLFTIIKCYFPFPRGFTLT